MGDALVVVREYGRDVQPVWAGHAIVAGGAGHGLQLDELLGHAHEEIVLFGRDGAQWRVGLHVLLQVFHIGHAAQDGEDAFGRAGIAEGPAGDRSLGFAFLHLFDDVVGLLGKTASEQRLHDDHRDAPAVQLLIEIG